jgi:hypothetical protein
MGPIGSSISTISLGGIASLERSSYAGTGHHTNAVESAKHVLHPEELGHILVR